MDNAPKPPAPTAGVLRIDSGAAAISADPWNPATRYGRITGTRTSMTVLGGAADGTNNTDGPGNRPTATGTDGRVARTATSWVTIWALQSGLGAGRRAERGDGDSRDELRGRAGQAIRT